MVKQDKKSYLLGLGLDGNDGHRRITMGHNFRLYGGSEETHSTMQEKAVKFNEELKKIGKSLDEVSRSEFKNIAENLGLKVFPKTN
jgi:hypothetical protein